MSLLSTASPPPAPAAAGGALPALMRRPLPWLLAWAAAHVALRLALSPALRWDEAEQTLWSQHLAWGYGMQPPLYTWLQWGFNAVLGPSVLSLAVLKHVLLALTYLFMGLAARALLPPRTVWWAAASMVMLPPLGWSSLHDQTHTVLVTAVTAGTWWVLVGLVRSPRPARYALLGLMLALGMLSKYNFALFAAALGLAALGVPAVRQVLLARGLWITAAVALVLVAPHALWLAGHWHETARAITAKMELQPRGGLLGGLDELALTLLETLLPWALLAAWAFRGAWLRRPPAGALAAVPWAWPLLARYLALVLAAFVGMVVLGGVTEFKEHWMQPVFCVLPLAAFVARPQLESAPGGARFTGAVLGVALLFFLATAAYPWVAGWRGRPGELNQPIRALVQQLRAAGYDGRGPIVAADHMLAGALRTRFPAAPAADCDGNLQPVAACVAEQRAGARAAGTGWLLISRDDRLPEGWWDQAQTVLPAGSVPRVLALPRRHVPAGSPPEIYRFIWFPREGTSP